MQGDLETTDSALTSQPRQGAAQTVVRAVRVLQRLAAAPAPGARLTDLARDLGLTKPTVHRLVAALVEVGMASHDPGSRRYRLGAAAMMLGQTAGRANVAYEARQGLVRLALATQDTVFVSVAEGPAAICVGREIGSHPIRTVTLAVGDQRPLGVGAGSMALLAALPDAQIDPIIARNAKWLERYPLFDPDFLRAEVRATRQRGHAVNRNRVVNGMSAIGVCALAADGRPLASFSVACVSERIAGPREAELVALLREEAERLALAFRTAPTVSNHTRDNHEPE